MSPRLWGKKSIELQNNAQSIVKSKRANYALPEIDYTGQLRRMGTFLIDINNLIATGNEVFEYTLFYNSTNKT